MDAYLLGATPAKRAREEPVTHFDIIGDSDSDESTGVVALGAAAAGAAPVGADGVAAAVAPAGKAAPARKPRKPKAAGEKVPTHEQQRRRLGDAVKGHITFVKWGIQAHTHAEVELDAATFRANLVPHASRVTPADWTEASPVVVARIEGRAALGEAFGKSKIVGGNRYQTWSAEKCDVVFRPADKAAALWWTMR
jgi:hypothetical protein